uniref:Uncharacterized protein n=1 Tax=Panagrolaimus sp. ES5 TaxID=591445 RepID=A0AC34G0B0_9BILA
MFSFPDISDHSPNPPTLVPPSAIVHTAPKMQPFIHTAFTAQSNSKMMASDAFAPLSATSAASGAGAATGESSSGSCVSKQCEACRLHVLEGFSQALNASSQFNKRISGEHGEMNECPYVQTKQKEKAAQKEKLSRINSQNDHTVNQMTKQKEKEAQKEKLSRINSQNDHTVNQMVNLLKQAQKRKRRDISDNGINNDIDNDNLDSVSSVDQSALKDKRKLMR